MARSGRFAVPPTWSEAALEAQRREAIADFIKERTTEGGTQYREAFRKNVTAVEALFVATDDLLDFPSGTALANNPSFTRAARYLGGPPVSADDLNTLAESSIATRKRLDADLGRKAARIIESALDPERFPWLFEAPRRSPRRIERRTAIRWTAGLQT